MVSQEKITQLRKILQETSDKPLSQLELDQLTQAFVGVVPVLASIAEKLNQQIGGEYD